jgi:hypothetical protein
VGRAWSGDLEREPGGGVLGLGGEVQVGRDAATLSMMIRSFADLPMTWCGFWPCTLNSSSNLAFFGWSRCVQAV